MTYDTNGRLIRVVGPFGHQLSLLNDANGRVSRATAPDGGVYQYAYDAANNLVSVTYPGGKTRQYVYENASFPNALSGIIDENGARFATFAYQADGKAVSSGHAGGVERTTFVYNADGTTTITSPLGAAQTYAFAHLFGVKKPSAVSGTPDPSTGGKAFAYDARGFLWRQVDWKGNVTRYAHDARGNETSRIEAYGTALARTTTTQWHPTFNLPKLITEAGRSTNYDYDPKGNLLTKTVAAGTLTRVYSYIYTAFGQVETATDPAGNLTRYEYDASGNLAKVTDAKNHVTNFTNYDGAGRLKRVVDPNNVVSTFDYDPRGRLTRTIVDAEGAAPAITAIEYDGVGQITKITQPNGVFESYAYDGAHRLTTVTNAAGETINYTRDLASNVTLVEFKRADGTTTYSRTQEFDPINRMIRRIGALAQTYQFFYDNNNNLIKVIDPRAKLHRYGYDALDRLATDTDEEAKTVTLTRDWTDAVNQYDDARGLSTLYGVNGFGERTGETSPDRGSISYERDLRGLVTKMTDARGQETAYGYDQLGRLIGKTYTNGAFAQAFTWDCAQPYGVGRLCALQSEAGLSQRQFDSKGRVTIETRTNGPVPSLATQYTYDAAGNVTQMVYPSGRVVTYARDAAGRVSAVTTQQNLSASAQTIVSNVTWQPYGPQAGMSFGNGMFAQFSSNTDYRITQVQTGPAAAPSVVNRTLAWTGDVIDRIDDAINPGRSERLYYKATRRLASARGMYGALDWTYDANGNRLSEAANGVVSTYSYPATSNRLDSVTPAGGTARSLAYDASGNITADSRAGALGMSFEYDAERRLLKAYETNAPANVSTYGYDALSRLASRTVTNGATTTTILYIHDLSNHIIAETDTGGVTKREYIWLGDLPVAVVANAGTVPVVSFVHTDHLGRPVRMRSALTPSRMSQSAANSAPSVRRARRIEPVSGAGHRAAPTPKPGVAHRSRAHFEHWFANVASSEAKGDTKGQLRIFCRFS